jgi:hypothetical protein
MYTELFSSIFLTSPLRAQRCTTRRNEMFFSTNAREISAKCFLFCIRERLFFSSLHAFALAGIFCVFEQARMKGDESEITSLSCDIRSNIPSWEAFRSLKENFVCGARLFDNE